jgi:hypothetical protein
MMWRQRKTCAVFFFFSKRSQVAIRRLRHHRTMGLEGNEPANHVSGLSPDLGA